MKRYETVISYKRKRAILFGLYHKVNYTCKFCTIDLTISCATDDNCRTLDCE